ncbi:hypothetical protein MHM84_20095 [Halomonas sp. McH1-25]|uniref:hypothetical protein n=1 Tax=unclassified Halomonas TaxID=2609666 RepID=UPI001EF6C619|nr:MULTISPECIES: hypothetical protein [unclassified Halomonas]MCG7602049.1 hypothetical protein [Halomonas sp. McH1-25]MCP1342885.1 hypothetical protein [Halomonas sp. FL8]MCP1361676.1 hypothetical protein [Halomonas sp. BBD45]MCP1363627.1 hypothetical protein [Halomonas sp. BBD48]
MENRTSYDTQEVNLSDIAVIKTEIQREYKEYIESLKKEYQEREIRLEMRFSKEREEFIEERLILWGRLLDSANDNFNQIIYLEKQWIQLLVVDGLEELVSLEQLDSLLGMVKNQEGEYSQFIKNFENSASTGAGWSSMEP